MVWTAEVFAALQGAVTKLKQSFASLTSALHVGGEKH